MYWVWVAVLNVHGWAEAIIPKRSAVNTLQSLIIKVSVCCFAAGVYCGRGAGLPGGGVRGRSRVPRAAAAHQRHVFFNFKFNLKFKLKDSATLHCSRQRGCSVLHG